MMCIKTMTNSWFTSRLLANAGVPMLNYILGCEDCVDDLSHYLQCHVIWSLVCSAMKLDNTRESLDGIDRVGFLDPDPIHIYTVCVMFKCYHASHPLAPRNDFAYDVLKISLGFQVAPCHMENNFALNFSCVWDACFYAVTLLIQSPILLVSAPYRYILKPPPLPRHPCPPISLLPQIR
jgi:hypothetical protein